MKKRLISLVLTLVMLVSLCASFGTSAAADANVTTVTLAKGDTVYGLCSKLGVNYNTYKNLIMTLNGFTSESQFSGLAVGSQIVLPSSESAAKALLNGAATAISGSTAAAASTVTTTSTLSTGASAIPSGDYVSYYIVSYTIQNGETIGGIYSNWGLSYKTYENQIKKLNGISNFNSITAGKTLLLPTTSPALASAAYYTVMGHVVKSGETAYDIICGSYGLNLSASQNMILALNNVTNLNNITAGATLYIPVTGLVSATSTVSTSTAVSTTTATVNTSANYNLVTQTSEHGSFDLMVDGKSVTTAQAGKTVSIVATPEYGYTIDTVKVIKVGDSNANVAINNNSFVMPSYSVIVSVTFKQAVAYTIDVDSSSHGSVVAMVNGNSVTKGYVGNTVYVRAIPDPGFMLANVRVTYNDYKDSVAVQNNQFIMPSTGVNVTANFVVDPDYDPSKGCAIYVDSNFCTVTTLVGDKEAQYAKSGDVVKLEIVPYTNYTVESIKVYNSDFSKVLATDKLSFTMPDAPVNVVITVKPTPNAEFAVSVVDPVNGTVAITVDDKEVKSAKVGQTVKVTPTETKPAYNSVVTVYKTNDPGVAVPVVENEDGTVCFTMPEYAVTVRVKFYTYYNVNTHASNGQYGYYGVVWANNASVQVTKAAAGVELMVGFAGVATGYSVSEILLVYADGSTVTLQGNTFIMPDCDVTVRVKFSESATVRAYAITENDTDKSNVYPAWGNTYTIGEKTLNDLKANSIDVTVASGSNVTVTPTAAIGSVFDKIVYTYKDKSGNIKSGTVTEKNPTTLKYQFTMPEMAEGTVLELRVYFKEIKTYAINHDYSNKGTDQTNVDHSRGTYSFITAYDVADHAAEDTKIYIRSEATDGYKADLSGVVIYRTSDMVDVTLDPDVNYDKINHSFFMPPYDLTVYVPFVESMFWVKLEKSIDYTNGRAMGELTAIVGTTHFTEETMTQTGDGKNNVRTVFESGTKIQLVNQSATGYTLNSETPFLIYQALDSEGNYNPSAPLNKSLMVEGSTDTFILPNFNVVVKAFYDNEVVNVIAESAEHGSFKVPAQVDWSKPFEITEVYPDEGYELSKILVSYVDYNGVPHKEDEILAPSKTITLEGGGKPQSDVTVKVVFAAVKNTVYINYKFAATPVEGQADYYNVNLNKYDETSDGAIEITRDVTTPWGLGLRYDHVTKENGIPTGSYVKVSRYTAHYDQNFFITAVTVTNNNNPVEVVTDGTDYYFYMPYAANDDKATGCVITVTYSNSLSGIYLSGKTIGSEEVLNVSYKVFNGSDDVEATMAEPGDIISALIDVPANITISKVYSVYTDSEGNTHREDITDSTVNIGGVKHYRFTVPVLPTPATASLEYEAVHQTHKVDFDGSKFALSAFIGDTPLTPDGSGKYDVPWGSVVTVKLTKEGTRFIKISVTGVADEDITALGDSTFSFVMPEADVTITSEGKSATKYKVSLDSNVRTAAKAVITNTTDGSVVENDAVAYKDDVIRFKIEAKPGFVVGKVKVNTTDLTAEADGYYKFTVGEGDAILYAAVTREEKTAKVVYTADSQSQGCTFTRLRDGSPKDFENDNTTTTLAINDTVSYTIPVGYVLSYMDVKYKNADGETGTYIGNVENKTFTITDTPATEIEIEVKLVLDSAKSYAITKKVNTPDATKYANATTLSISASTDEDGKAYVDSYVSVSLEVRYDLEYKSSEVTYTAKGGGTTKQALTLTGGYFDSTGMVKVYSGSFVMPDADVEITIETKEAEEINIVASTGVAGIYNSSSESISSTEKNTEFYVAPMTADGYTAKKAVVTYSVFDSSKDAEPSQSKNITKEFTTTDGNGNFKVTVPECGMNHSVTVEIVYEATT